MRIPNAVGSRASRQRPTVILFRCPDRLDAKSAPDGGARTPRAMIHSPGSDNHRLSMLGNRECSIPAVARSPPDRAPRGIVEHEIAVTLHVRNDCTPAGRVRRPYRPKLAVVAVHDEVAVVLHDSDVLPFFGKHGFTSSQAFSWLKDARLTCAAGQERQSGTEHEFYWANFHIHQFRVPWRHHRVGGCHTLGIRLAAG